MNVSHCILPVPELAIAKDGQTGAQPADCTCVVDSHAVHCLVTAACPTFRNCLTSDGKPLATINAGGKVTERIPVVSAAAPSA